MWPVSRRTRRRSSRNFTALSASSTPTPSPLEEMAPIANHGRRRGHRRRKPTVGQRACRAVSSGRCESAHGGRPQSGHSRQSSYCDSPRQMRRRFGFALGESGLQRIERDVLEQRGVRLVVLRLGANDIAFPGEVSPVGERIRARDIIAANCVSLALTAQALACSSQRSNHSSSRTGTRSRRSTCARKLIVGARQRRTRRRE